MPSPVVPLPHLHISAEPQPQTLYDSSEITQRWEDHSARLVAVGGPTRDGWWIRWTDLATFLLSSDDRPVLAYPIRPNLEPWIHDVFARAITPIVLLSRGFEGLHASGVLGPRGVVAFCGLSETGKSTLALALARTGLPHFADDVVMYYVEGGGPIAVPIPFPVRVGSSDIASPSLPPSPEGPMPRVAAGALTRVYLLKRDYGLAPSTPVFARIPAVERFERLLTHAHPFEMGGAARHREFLENVLSLARTVDVWECRFAPDLTALSRFAATVRAHIAEP